MALSEAAAHAECEAVRSVSLEDTSYRRGAWVPGLFRVWLHKEGARLMGAASAWCDLMREAPVDDLDAPRVFSLDGVVTNLVVGGPNSDSWSLRSGRAPLRGTWWRLTWATACEEVRQRYGELLRIRCKGEAADGDVVHKVGVAYTMKELYKKIHAPPAEKAALVARERELMVIGNDLYGEEKRRGRAITGEELGEKLG